MQQGFFARGHDDSPFAVGGPAQVHPHEWSAVTYNTLSCKPDRLRHILHKLRYNRFVGLQGTNRRAKSHEPAVTQSRVGKYIVFDFPSRGGIFPSKGAGVIVALHRSAFSEANVVKVFVPPDDFSGRIGGVRVKRRDVDFCVFSIYIPVEPRTAAERRKLDKIWRYLHWLIEQLPSRCVPIVLCDGNGRTGSVPSQGIGHANPQRENHNGSQLRKLLDTQHLAAINTFFPVGHTWRGSMGISSRIDYVLLPTATHIRSCRILHDSARELQVIPAPGWRDHKPVQVVFHHALGYVGVDQTEPIRWDRDAIAQSLMYGTDRVDFVTAVEAACSEPHMLSPSTSVDQKWHRLNGTITKIAQRFFHQNNKVHRKHPQDTQDAFNTMVAARTQLVKQPEHRIFQLDPGSGSPMHEDLQVLLQRWNLLTKFRIARRQHDQLCARDRLSRDMALVDEFTDYWQKRQMANVWRTARQLSGKALGPKRRRFDVPLCSQPSKHDWEHFFAQDGPSGGCSALPCNMESRLSAETPSLEPAVKVLSDSAAFSLATGDFQRLARSLWKQQLRKAVPPWSMPVEIWRILLFPAWYLRRPRFGVGASSLVPSTPKLHALLLELLTDVRAYNQAPLAWQTSLGHKINKGNQKEGCAGLRVVNCLDPIGKAYYTQLWKRGDRQSQRHYASGYCSRKSRIDAMVQQHVVGYRLRKSRKSYGKCFLDVANAFYSPKHTCLDSAVARVAHAEDLDLLQQRYKKAAVCIQASDAWASVCPRTGALQGDTSASDMFLEVYHPQIDVWNAAMPQICVQDPISNFIVDVSLATYADDVSKVLECHGADDLVHKVAFLNDQFDDALQTVGMAQNHDKQEHVPFFAGQGAHQHYKHVLEHQNALPGKCGRSARYLGGRQHHLDNVEEELEARHRAARVSWATFGKLWSRSELPRRALCIIFAGTVVTALLSGLEALVLSSAQLRRLDSIILTYGRKLMRGAACQKEVLDGAIKFKACTSRQVWEYLRLVPCEIELRIRRLGWLQQLVRSPVLHCNVLAALFGKFPSDPETVPSFSINTNPWAQQLHNDVQTLGELDSGVCFLPFLQSDFSKIFSEFKPDFLYVDVSEFRAKYFSISIPPPGWVPEADLEPPDVEPVDDNLPYECECLLDDDTICGRKFATLQQLATHVRKFKAGNHGAIPQHYRAVVTNQCPWCRVVHCNIRTTRIHVQKALQRKKCRGRGSPYTFTPKLPSSLECPICTLEFSTLDELHDHITQHFAGPWRHVD